MNPLERFLSTRAEIFVPLLPAIICGELILGFRNLVGGIQFGEQTLAQISQFWATVYNFLWLIGEAIFHFLPVGITWSVVKKMDGSQILGNFVGHTSRILLTGKFAVIGSIIFSFLYAPLVITGIYHTTNTVESTLVQQLSGTMIFPLLALSNISQATASLVISFASKDIKKMWLFLLLSPLNQVFLNQLFMV